MPRETPIVTSSEELVNHCFGCSPLNPHGLHLQFVVDAHDIAAISASATIQLTRAHEGAPGWAHGGIIATMLDEAMTKLNRAFSVTAPTRHLEIDCLRPVPLGAELKVVSQHVRRDGRKLFHTAEIIGPDGKTLAKAKGLFVVISSPVS